MKRRYKCQVFRPFEDGGPSVAKKKNLPEGELRKKGLWRGERGDQSRKSAMNTEAYRGKVVIPREGGQKETEYQALGKKGSLRM